MQKQNIKHRTILIVLVISLMFSSSVVEVDAYSNHWVGQFAGFLGSDEGTIDNCRFEWLPNPDDDWRMDSNPQIVERVSHTKHANDYSLRVKQRYNVEIVISQEIDPEQLEEIKNHDGQTSPSPVLFSFWYKPYKSTENEQARAVIKLKRSGDWYTYEGDWTDPSPLSGDLRWTLVSIEKQVDDLTDEMIVEIHARDPDGAITHVYVDDARLAITFAENYYAPHADLRMGFVFESCHDWAAEEGWNELVFSASLGIEPDPGWKIYKVNIIMELHPLVLIWPFPPIYSADCEAQIEILKKHYTAQVTCPPNGDNTYDDVPLDLPAKSLEYTLKFLSAGIKKAVGVSSFIGGVVTSIALGEFWNLMINTFYDDDLMAEGGIWNRYATRTTWDWLIGDPPGYGIRGGFENKAAFRWKTNPVQDIDIRVWGEVQLLGPGPTVENIQFFKLITTSYY